MRGSQDEEVGIDRGENEVKKNWQGWGCLCGMRGAEASIVGDVSQALPPLPIPHLHPQCWSGFPATTSPQYVSTYLGLFVSHITGHLWINRVISFIPIERSMALGRKRKLNERGPLGLS